MEHGIAVKAFIVSSGKILLLRRVDDDPHKPGAWEVPGGRLKNSEDIAGGLRREVLEECGLEIVVGPPLAVHHFTRDDGQKIAMMTFLCSTKDAKVILGKEHTEYRWLAPEDAKKIIHAAFCKDIDAYLEFFSQ